MVNFTKKKIIIMVQSTIRKSFDDYNINSKKELSQPLSKTTRLKF